MSQCSACNAPCNEATRELRTRHCNSSASSDTCSCPGRSRVPPTPKRGPWGPPARATRPAAEDRVPHSGSPRTGGRSMRQRRCPLGAWRLDSPRHVRPPSRQATEPTSRGAVSAMPPRRGKIKVSWLGQRPDAARNVSRQLRRRARGDAAWEAESTRSLQPLSQWTSFAVCVCVCAWRLCSSVTAGTHCAWVVLVERFRQ